MTVEKTEQSAALESFWDYRESMKRRLKLGAPSSLADPLGHYEANSALTPLNERLIQAVWANQLLRPEGLKLLDGRTLRVLDAGRWNGAAGPDFSGAKLMIDSQIVSGDVEIHLQSSLWLAHGHHTDLDYNRVVLHVVYQNDDGGEADTLHNGKALPRLELEPYLSPDLETIQRSLTPDDLPYDRPSTLGRCYELMVGLEGREVADFLDKAGDERLATKVGRLQDQARTADLEQVFYQSLMMSLGSGAAKSLYYLLAKRTPLRQTFEDMTETEPALRSAGFEALLLHVGGLAPHGDEMTEAPAESVAYAARIREIWKGMEPYWSDRIMAPTRRWYRGVRPVNFPTRRLGAVAGLLARSINSGRLPLEALAEQVRGNLSRIFEAKAQRRVHPVVRELIEWFRIKQPDSFWTYHYSFTARPSGRALRLIGEGSARSLAFNAALPALALMAEQTGDEELGRATRRLYQIFPPLPPNHITQFMSYRLFGETSRAKELITTERRQQGLFQIFYACCNSQERDCESCYYLTAQ